MKIAPSAINHKIAITMNNTVLELLEGDITDQRVEAIVNAANEKLALGGASRPPRRPVDPGGVQPHRRHAAGMAVVTGAGKLPFKVIHAVGPRWGDGDEDRASAAVRWRWRCDRHCPKSIAMPAISLGNFGFPLERGARVTLTEIHRYPGGTCCSASRWCLRRAHLERLSREAARVSKDQSRAASRGPTPSLAALGVVLRHARVREQQAHQIADGNVPRYPRRALVREALAVVDEATGEETGPAPDGMGLHRRRGGVVAGVKGAVGATRGGAAGRRRLLRRRRPSARVVFAGLVGLLTVEEVVEVLQPHTNPTISAIFLPQGTTSMPQAEATPR
jgi:O-acetyl-ADP-ribose deacetylase (regulator of RNase III)